jgi:taurine dioxygenase
MFVEPSGQSCGATIHGVDLAEEISAEVVDRLRAVWLEHLVISFPEQHLSLDRFEEVALLFGEFGHDPYFVGLADHPRVAEVKREADEQSPIFAEAWHSDWSFLATPPSGTLLYGREIPPVGGDTLFANQHGAYDALSGEMKQRLAGLVGVHSARRGYSRAGQYGEKDTGRSMAIRYSDDALATQNHPLVKTHPETGRPSLFMSLGYTIALQDSALETGALETGALETGALEETGRPTSTDELQELLVDLYRHQAQDQFVYRHRWSPNMLTMWDNRCVNHAATGGYAGHRRLLQRITITERNSQLGKFVPNG